MIKIATLNVCLGLTNKKDLISDILNVNKIDILCIQESEIENINVSFLGIKNYVLEISNCTPKSRTCVYIKENIPYKRLVFDNADNVEILAIDFNGFILINYY